MKTSNNSFKRQKLIFSKAPFTLITGDGTFSIALTTTNNTEFSLASREAGANAPQLILETTP